MVYYCTICNQGQHFSSLWRTQWTGLLGAIYISGYLESLNFSIWTIGFLTGPNGPTINWTFKCSMYLDNLYLLIFHLELFKEKDFEVNHEDHLSSLFNPQGPRPFAKRKHPVGAFFAPPPPFISIRSSVFFQGHYIL